MSRVFTGLDVLKRDAPLSCLERKRIGVLFNQSSVTMEYESIVDLLNQMFPGELKAFFSPQHGIYGTEQANMIETESSFDETFGVPIFSLYSKNRMPTRDMYSMIDVLIADLQDVGCRVFTYISTLYLCMCAASEYGKHMVVLDRPNPINGVDIEAPVLKQGFESFVGVASIPLRHGLTLGEAALFLNRKLDIGCDIEIISMRGWERDMYYEETGVPWVMPSPNMPLPHTCVVYPGQVLLEGTNISEGRGTTRPFEIFGAPFIEPNKLLGELSKVQLPGCKLRKTYFKPVFDKWAGCVCGGCQIHIVDRREYKPVLTSVSILSAIYRLYKNKGFEWRSPPYEYEDAKLPIDIICGTDVIRKGIENDMTAEQILSSFDDEIKSFKADRKKFLIY